MQIQDLIKPISEMTNEELQEKVRQIRHRREIARPVAAKKAERAEKKATQAKTKKLDKTLDALSEEELLAMIEKLGGSTP
ncbi:MAG TPA: hypothetical protein VF077_09055 [Nitrospiraceae bacterium]